MSNSNDAKSMSIRKQAECEMAAFLRATAEVLGPDGQRRAADAWLHLMESLNWPEDGHQRFFRSVSILAIAQLLANFSPNASNAGPTEIESGRRLPASRAAL